MKNSTSRILVVVPFLIVGSALLLVSASFTLGSENWLKPALQEANVPAPPKDDWEVLFDGHNLNKWQNSTSDSIPYKGWKIENGTLVVNSGRIGGDIITRSTYQNFDLKLDFKLTESANSGIKYLVNRIRNAKTNTTSLMGVEYQIIDDFNYPEVKPDPNGTSSTGAVYLLYPPQGKKLLPIGQWNQVRIVVRGKQCEHWLNGKMIAQYERNSNDFKEKVAQTKFNDYPDYALADSGHILLQDHGNQVYFRNILIKRLR